MAGNSTTFGGASKQTPNIRAHNTPIKNPAKIAKIGKQAHNRAASKKGGSQKQSGSTAAPVAAATKPTPVVSTTKSRDTAPAESHAPAIEVDVVEDLIQATATTALSSRTVKNDYLVKEADRLSADPARHLSFSPKKAAKGIKDSGSTADAGADSNAVSSSFGEKIEQKLDQKLVKREVKAGRKNKPKKAGANEKDRREFRSVY